MRVIGLTHGQARFLRIDVMTREFLTIPVSSVTEGTIEAIMWVIWGSPGIPLVGGDLHITHPELCDDVLICD
jgi:hypothetical protein